MISSLEESKDLSKISLTELINALQAQEQRRLLRQEEATETALQVKHKGKSIATKCEKKFVGEHYGKATRKKERLKLQQQNQPSHTSQKANVTETNNTKELLFMAKTTRTLEDGDTWFIDSGYKQHMTSKPKKSSELKPIAGSIKIGNAEKFAITGKGTVEIDTETGNKYIYDVLLVPELDQNLLSVGQMMQNGYCLLCKEGSCVVTNVTGHELFEVVLDSKLRDKRFGHYKLKSIQFAQEQELVKDLPDIQTCSEVCKGCQLGKQHRFPFPTSATWRASEKLELVHTDVCDL
ncbi:hypothetical protein A2U01_0000415 [Trifolium medium]|uniref:Retrovirus-related Pol polyprotein from transposon TNT 1-94-like beta-barrel domain-containing protein n=1 Tax=Trifolium medium TaxID=97028 RepID=A0A392LXI3_9FABA|nr:hypothetical protein [Trifolium medium]